MPAPHSRYHACVERDSNVMEDGPENPGIWKVVQKQQHMHAQLVCNWTILRLAQSYMYTTHAICTLYSMHSLYQSSNVTKAMQQYVTVTSVFHQLWCYALEEGVVRPVSINCVEQCYSITSGPFSLRYWREGERV